MTRVVRAATAVLGTLTVVAALWALFWPAAFSGFVNFAPHRHFVHDIAAFELGIGAALLLAMIWGDALMTALAGYAVAGVAHTVVHVADSELGGSAVQTWLIGVLALAAVGVPRALA
jgi:hypothetical protein